MKYTQAPQSQILITGVGKRIGLALARHFLAKGDRVIGSYRSHYPVIDELQAQGAELSQVDFYEPDEVDAFILWSQSKANEYGSGLRAIIHNASDWLPDNDNRPDAEIFQRMMQIHAGVPYQINRALAHCLRDDNSAHTDIIHITDYVASRGSKKHIAYSASKAALENMTLSFAAGLAPDIKVNSIAPALVMFNEHDPDDYREKALKKSLMEKEGGLSEFIATVDFLMHNQYITGRSIPFDGGRHLKS